MSFYVILYLSISVYHILGAGLSLFDSPRKSQTKLPVKDRVSSLSVKVTLGDDERARPKGNNKGLWNPILESGFIVCPYFR